ncbi:murein biosynthesis integral membrane protein MurJ [Neisseria sp. Ec49-e6-T10]|uniref:murein biosynthesis integral membrane protein MurJ n=1 Tax=Neisseria sp. Ec49-e6-T10 TaxID=3140744 RepID=UPI003EBB059F
MNLLKALATVSSMTMVSRVLGFVRDMIIARIFGAGMATDAFFVAFKLPNLLRRIFAEGAFSQAFVPIFTEYKHKKTHEETQAFLAKVAGLLSLVLFVVTAIGILVAPWVIYISAPGFTDDQNKFDLTVSLLRITFPYIFLISLSSLVGSVLNAYHKFSIPAFTPTFLNISFIVCSLYLTPYFDPPVLVLAWAVFIGGILQLAFQLPYLKKIGLLVWPKIDFKDSAVLRVLKQMGPAILGVSVAQVSLVINTIFASFLQSGSVSWMYYADRLMEFPTGILGVALGTILLPTLSKHATKASTEEFSHLLDWGIKLSLLLSLPAAVGLAVLSMPLIATLFVRGQFSMNDAVMTQQALIAYAIGLTGLILVKVLAPGFYSRQNIKTPVKVAIVTLCATQLMNLMFVWKLAHAGLALSIGLGACLNAAILFYLLVKSKIYRPQKGWGGFFMKISIALVLMGGSLWFANTALQLSWDVSMGLRVMQLTALVLLGAFVYFVALYLLGFRLRHFKRVEMQ